MVDVAAKIREWLFPWQVDWMLDQSRWKIALKSRQIGWTEISAFEALMHAIRMPNHLCFLVSTKVANARRQILDRIKSRWLPILQTDPDISVKLDGVEVYKNYIELPNGSKIIATAHDPTRLRGNTDASYWFDEFAFWQSRIHEALVDAVWPQIEARQNRHSVLRIFSTPWTMHGNLFWQIWSNAPGHHVSFSRHKVDVYEAIRRGLPFDLDAARAKYPRDKFAREYECEFLKIGERYFDRVDLLDRSYENGLDDLDGDLFMGVDLGKTNDFTSVVLLRDVAGHMVVGPVYMMRSVSFSEQGRVIDDLINRHDPAEVHVDTTAHQSFVDDHWDGQEGILGKHGNRERKVDNTMALKNHVENGEISFAYDEAFLYSDGAFERVQTRFLLDDLAKVKQTETPSGKQRFEVPRDDTGHGDSYSALELALNAHSGGGIGLIL